MCACVCVVVLLFVTTATTSDYFLDDRMRWA